LTVDCGPERPGFPESTVNRGFGSNVSMCDGPPRMHKKITRFARAAKCGGFGASGSAASLPTAVAAALVAAVLVAAALVVAVAAALPAAVAGSSPCARRASQAARPANAK
jgi:hypothetical protein